MFFKLHLVRVYYVQTDEETYIFMCSGPTMSTSKEKHEFHEVSRALSLGLCSAHRHQKNLLDYRVKPVLLAVAGSFLRITSEL